MGYGDSRETDDGAIIETSIPVSKKQGEYIRFNNTTIYKAQVDDVIYVDDDRNITGQVEYILTLLSFKAGDAYRKVFNAVSLNGLGGINDYSEKIYKAKSRELVRGKEKGKAYSENTNGDIVAVMFLEGNEQSPVIIGPWFHPRNTKKAKKDDGHRMKGEYNGIEWEINKDGEFTLKSLGGPRDDNQNLTNESNGGILIKLSKDGKITLETGDQPKITVDKNSNEVTIEANKIKVGNNAIEPIVLGNQWVAYTNAEIVAKLNALIAAFGTLVTSIDSHTHAYTWTDPAGASVTSPPPASGVSGPSAAGVAGPLQLSKKGVVE